MRKFETTTYQHFSEIGWYFWFDNNETQKYGPIVGHIDSVFVEEARVKANSHNALKPIDGPQ